MFENALSAPPDIFRLSQIMEDWTSMDAQDFGKLVLKGHIVSTTVELQDVRTSVVVLVSAIEQNNQLQ